jgi:hypothetical protein
MTTVILLLAPPAALVALVVARKHVLGTTLIVSWWWSIAALLAASSVEYLALGRVLSDDNTLAALRYTARVLLLCPTISVLGAKRPQDGPWNFVVVSLWGILTLPALQAIVLNSGQSLEIGVFPACVLLVLLLLSLANSLPTRHGWAGLAAAGGQWLLLNDYLPLGLGLSRDWLSAAGFLLLALAALVLASGREQVHATCELDRLWLDFRDRFALFWSLRLQERMQAASKMYRWPVALQWRGWDRTSELTTEQHAAILTTLRGLLRRFVSEQWIAQRLAEQDHNVGPPPEVRTGGPAVTTERG